MSNLAKTLWTITITIWVSLFVATHIPQVRVPRIIGGDKTAHLIAFFVLASLLGASMIASNPDRRGIAWRVLIICLIYGAFDELSQELVGRYAEWRDYAYDVGGTLIACALLVLFAIRRQRTRASTH